MNAIKLFVLVAGVVCGTLAFAETYTWTGGGDGVSWKSPANWGGSGYPSAAADVAKFEKAATVTLDTGSVTDIAYLTVATKGIEVTVNATEGSAIRLNAAPNSWGNGLVTAKGAILHMNAPVIRENRFDWWNRGIMTFGAVVTNVNNGNNTFLSAGTNIFTHGGGYYQDCGACYLGNGFTDDCSSWMTIELEDDAFFRVPNSVLNVNYAANNRQSVLIRQNGAGTLLEALALDLGYYAANTNQVAAYELISGHLVVSNFFLADYMPASYYQTGGTATVYNLSFQQNQASKLDFKVHGGRLEVTSEISFPANAKMAISLKDCTIACANSYSIAAKVKMSGTITFEVPSGKVVTIACAPECAPGLKFVKTGAGELKIDCDMPMPHIDVQAGIVRCATGRELFNPEGDYTSRFVHIARGGQFIQTDATTRLTAPLEVDCDVSEDGSAAGECRITSGRCGFFCRSFATNGVKLAQGRYDGGFCKAFPMETYFWLHVPYTWTGAAGDCKYGTAGNWAENVVPPVDESTTFIDLSQATNLIMTSTLTIGGFIFNGNGGDRKLLVTRAGTSYVWRMGTGSYYSSSFVGPGREVVFRETEFRRQGSYMAITGGGRITVEGDNAIRHENAAWGENATPYLCLDLDLNFQFCTSSVPNRYFTFFSYQDVSNARIFFGKGLDVEMGTFIFTQSGFTTLRSCTQTDGKVSFDQIWLVNHAQASANPTTYYLEGGELIARTKLALGSRVMEKQRFRGEHFRMTGGILRTPLIEDECNSNYLYLLGGDAYLGAGGIKHTHDETYCGDLGSDGKTRGEKQIPNTTPSFQWGGTVVHAADDFAIDVDTELISNGGTPAIDTAGHTVTFRDAAISGSASWTKTGEGTLVLDGTIGFTGKLTVEEGLLRIGGNATFTAKPNIVLTNEESIELPQGAEIEVAALTVAGVRKTGSVSIGGGTITVAPVNGMWIGGASGNWSDAANWANGVVPTDGTTAVDFSLATADETVIALDRAITLGEVRGPAGGRTVTIRGSQTVTFAAPSSVTLPYGAKLVVEAPMSVPGYLDIYGGGEVVLAGDDAGSDGKYLIAHGGSTLALRGNPGTLGGLVAVTAAGSERYSTIRIEDGADVSYPNFPPHSSLDDSIGGRLEIVGGVYRVTNAGLEVGGNASRREILDVRGGLITFGSYTKGYINLQVNLYGGKVFCQNYYSRALFDSRTEVNVYGPVTFENEVKEHSLINALGGEGSFAYAGTSKFVLGGSIAALTNLSATVSGTLTVNADAAKTVSPETTVVLGGDAKLELDYDGTVTVRALYRNGKQLRKGLYGEGVAPSRRLAPIVGRGFLNVLEGDPSGGLIIIR